MKMTELFLHELDREAAGTRSTLQRVPEGRNDWKPHEKSMPLGYLAALVAKMPSWIAMVIKQDEMDFAARKESSFNTTAQATKASCSSYSRTPSQRGGRRSRTRTMNTC